jgi:hypothetical protein
MKEVEIKWCPTKEIVADFMTKPLQGSHFRSNHGYGFNQEGYKPKQEQV